MMFRNYRGRCWGLVSYREGNFYLFIRKVKEFVIQKVYQFIFYINYFCIFNEFIIFGRKLFIKEISGYFCSNNFEVVIFEVFQS